MTITKDQSWTYTLSASVFQEPSWAASQTKSYSRVCTLSRTRTGQRLHNWRKIIEDGGNATTPMSGVWDSADYRPVAPFTCVFRNSAGTLKETTKGYIDEANTRHVFNPKAPAVSIDFVDNLARVAFYKKLNALQTKFQGMVFLGELKETLHMLRRPARGLWDSATGYASALSKRKRRDPKHWTKAAGDLWLEHSFGWLPLINDCKDAVAAYHELVNPAPHTYKISAGAQKAYDRSNLLGSEIEMIEGSTLLWAGLFPWDVLTARWYETHTVRYKGALRATVEGPRWDNMSLFGFNPAQFIPTAWELLPWSFLADYFTNIGDLLTCLVTNTRDVTYVNRSTVRRTYLYHRIKYNPTKRASLIGAGTVVESSSSPEQVSAVTRREVTRAPGSGIPFPTLQFNINLSDGQLGNVAALLATCRSLHPQSVRPLHRLPGM